MNALPATPMVAPNPVPTPVLAAALPAAPSPHRQAFLETAAQIGRGLCRDALWSGRRCNWLGWSMQPLNGSWHPAYRAAGANLYDGTAGVALFLAQLWRHSRDAEVRLTLDGAVNHALSTAGAIDPSLRCAFYAGSAGVAWALLEIGALLGHEGLVRRGQSLLDEVAEADIPDHALDVIGGSAGLIPLLVDLGQRHGRGAWLAAAVRHGEHLLGQASRSAEGWSWDTMKIPGQPPLTGHSHGAAGIVTALLELHQLTGEERFREAAREGLRYERRHFVPDQGNWRDLRYLGQAPGASPACMLAWCHGAPGIGLARLRTRELLAADAEVPRELEIALATTATGLAQPVIPGQGNYSLCHGHCGNAELPLLAAARLGRAELRASAEAVAWQGIHQCHATGQPWPCGVAGAGETPSLMLGLAGIGYFYLRLADPEIPSVLIPFWPSTGEVAEEPEPAAVF